MCPTSIGTSQSGRSLKPEETKLWLLLVGVDHYDDDRLPDLRYSATDCQGLSEALREGTQAFPNKEMQVHHDGLEQRPTLAAVQTSLDAIATHARPQDTILFYFSGHGLQDPQHHQAVLCLADTAKENLLATGLSLQALLSALGRCRARQQLVWLDACHSGGMTLHSTQAETVAGQWTTSPDAASPQLAAQLIDVLRQQAAQSSGFYALLSCDRNQRSWEFPQLGHGVFTYYLMRGLRGEAADAQGVVSIDSLYRYVYYQTLRYIDKTNQQLRLINQQKRSRGGSQFEHEYPLQTPKRIVEGIGESILALRVAKAAPNYSRQAVLADGLNDTTASLGLSKVLRQLGTFDVTYWPQPGGNWANFRAVIRACLQVDDERFSPTATEAPMAAIPPDLTNGTTALLYLRGQLKSTNAGDTVLLLPDGTLISRWWLRQVLRHSPVAQQIVILDCPGGSDLAAWVDDLQFDDSRGQCLLAAASPVSHPDAFTQALRDTLAESDPKLGLSVAGWITQLQGRLALGAITPHFWLSGGRQVMEVLPSHPTAGRGATDTAADIGLCPYLGLRAFGEADAAFFFGREVLVQRLLQLLNRQPFVAVVGASGSGKSSVVQAGLMAQLRQGKQIPGSDTWWVRSFRPGMHPLRALAQTLAQPAQPDLPREQGREPLQIEGLLHLGPEGFVRWLRSRPEPMVVLVVDQFEELFTLASDQARHRFLELLLGAIDHADDRFKLVLTLRADFVAACLEIAALASKLQQSSVLVPPVLTEEQYRQIILRPAEKVGLAVEPELVTTLLQDLSQGVSDLPLLEFVLEQIWQQRQPGQLGLQVYQDQVGGLKGALERKAQSVYEALDWEAQDCARWIFLTLTQLGEGTDDTRRRVAKTDLVVAKYPQPLVEKTLQALTAAKLVVVAAESGLTGQGRGGQGPEEEPEEGPEQGPGAEGDLLVAEPVTVEIAHEILIRHWSTLRWWLEENRSRLRAQRQVEQAARAWLQSDRQPDFLLRGVPLSAAVELYINYTDELSADVQGFVEAGMAAQQAEAAQMQHRLRQARRGIALIGALALGALGLGGTAYWQRQQARLQSIETLNALSTAQLTNHQSLAATLSAIKAGQQFQSIPLQRLMGHQRSPLLAQTLGTLQQAVSLGAETNRLEGHSEQVNGIAYSPDGQLLASGSDDGTLKVWRTDGALLNSVVIDPVAAPQPVDGEAHSRVLDVAFSPDSQSVAVAQSNGNVTLWSVAADAPQQTLVAHADWVTAVAFSPNGQRLATASRDSTIKLWNLRNGQLVKTLTGHDGWVNDIAWRADGLQLASAGEDQQIKLWDVSRGQSVWTVTGHDHRVNTVAFSADGQWLASGGADFSLKLWHLTDRQAHLLGDHDAPINAVAFSPDDRTLLAVGDDGAVTLWPVAAGAPRHFWGHGGTVLSAAWQPDGHAVASASTDKTIRLWRPLPAAQIRPELLGAQVSPDGQLLAGTTWDGEIQLWPIADHTLGPRLNSLPAQDAYVFQLVFSGDGQWLAAANDDGVVRLWMPTDGELLHQLRGHQAAATAVAFSPDSRWLLSGSDDRWLKIWHPVEGTVQQHWLAHGAGVTAVAWHPQRRAVASGSLDKTVKIWTQAGDLQQTLVGHGEAISAIAFSPRGQYLASASWDNTLKLWRVRDGALLHTLTGHQNGVTQVAFGSDGQVIISASADGTLKLWRTQTGELLKTLLGHPQAIERFSLSGDHRLVVTTDADLTQQLWAWDLDQLLAQGCDRIRDYLASNPNVSERELCADL